LNFKDHLAHVFNFWAKPHGIGSFKQCQIPWMPILTFHPRCCLPGPAASGSGGGKKPFDHPALVTKGNGVRDCQLGTVRSRLTTCDRTQPEAYLRSYPINTAFKCIYSLIIRQPPIYNAAGCRCCRLPTRRDTALQVAPHGDAAASLYCNAAAAYDAMLQPLALCCRLAEYCLP
jgi:hypothetical protein